MDTLTWTEEPAGYTYYSGGPQFLTFDYPQRWMRVQADAFIQPGGSAYANLSAAGRCSFNDGPGTLTFEPISSGGPYYAINAVCALGDNTGLGDEPPFCEVSPDLGEIHFANYAFNEYSLDDVVGDPVYVDGEITWGNVWATPVDIVSGQGVAVVYLPSWIPVATGYGIPVALVVGAISNSDSYACNPAAGAPEDRWLKIVSTTTTTWGYGDATYAPPPSAILLSDGRVLVAFASDNMWFGTFTTTVVDVDEVDALEWVAATVAGDPYPDTTTSLAVTQLSTDELCFSGGIDSFSDPVANMFFGVISGDTITLTEGTPLPSASADYIVDVFELPGDLLLALGGGKAWIGGTINTISSTFSGDCETVTDFVSSVEERTFSIAGATATGFLSSVNQSTFTMPCGSAVSMQIKDAVERSQFSISVGSVCNIRSSTLVGSGFYASSRSILAARSLAESPMALRILCGSRTRWRSGSWQPMRFQMVGASVARFKSQALAKSQFSASAGSSVAADSATVQLTSFSCAGATTAAFSS